MNWAFEGLTNGARRRRDKRKSRPLPRESACSGDRGSLKGRPGMGLPNCPHAVVDRLKARLVHQIEHKEMFKKLQ
jgi:hypothetical protein